MAARRPTDDPYRALGVPRGAEPDAIKAAHRRLAKRFHPDGSMGDEARFLAVQEAYQLLTDPLRRRDWDRHHPAGEPPADRPAGRAGRRARPTPAPGARGTTWSAEHVPWWEDFRPREGAAGTAGAGDATGAPATSGADAATSGAEGAGAAGSAAEGAGAATSGAGSAAPARPAGPGPDMDVFSRSSGTAWSMAARRHFRRGDEDLPSRGAWRYRGTQVVTGAEARKVAAEEAAEQVHRADQVHRAEQAHRADQVHRAEPAPDPTEAAAAPLRPASTPIQDPPPAEEPTPR